MTFQFQGKSTLISRFLERDDPIKPTLALDYSFGRRSTHSFQKLVCNFWELGTVESSEKLMEIPFRGGKEVSTSSIVLVLDLSRPEELWATIEDSITQLREIIQRLAKDNYSSILEVAALRLGETYNDLSTLDVFPIPILIIGSKYDLYLNFDPEMKKQICRCIRSVGHLIGASVIFFSSQMTMHNKVLRDVLNSMGFNTVARPIRATTTDYMGPLLMACGQDSWEKIERPPSSFHDIGSHFNKSLGYDGKRKTKKDLPKDPVKEADFREPAIDEARAQKNEEILSFMRNAEIREKFENIVE